FLGQGACLELGHGTPRLSSAPAYLSPAWLSLMQVKLREGQAFCGSVDQRYSSPGHVSQGRRLSGSLLRSPLWNRSGKLWQKIHAAGPIADNIWMKEVELVTLKPRAVKPQRPRVL